MRLALLGIALPGCIGLTSNKGVDSTTTAIGTDAPPPTEVTLSGLVFGIGPGDFDVTEPAGAGDLVDQLFTYDVLVYVEEQLADSLHLDLSLAGADGFQNPCEPVVELPKAEFDNPTFQSGPADFTARLGGEPVTFHDFLLTGTFDPYAFGWGDGSLSAQFDAAEVDPALPEGLSACELLAGLGSPCVACADGGDRCFSLQLENITATLVSWPFDPTPDTSGC